MTDPARPGWLEQLRERGVLRVAAGYAVIGWLLLQIADVTFDPLGLPKWAMTALIFAVILGFPVAVILAWFYELGDHGVTRDSADATAVRPRVHGPRRFADVAIIGVLLVAVAVLLVRQSDFGKPPPPARPTLAVLPFANLSSDPEQQYFSDGLAEEVLDKLGQVPGLMVVARSSSFGFREKDIDVREVAAQLGVNAVLEGAVRRDGKRLRLSAKLVDGKTGYQLWSGSFDREVNDVFAVQAELAQAVIDAIVPVARGDQPIDARSAPPPTTSLTAYDLYLLGRAQANTRWSTSMQKAATYFEQALEQDPKFAKAQSALATARVYQILDRDLPEPAPEQRVAIAEAAVYKALALDPNLAETQVAYANLLRVTERGGAEDAFKRAIKANPNSAEAWHGFAVYLDGFPERRAESEKATIRAHELDPLAISPWMNYIRVVMRPGGKELRAELEKAKVAFADQPDALRRFAIAAGTSGYPLEAWWFVTQTRKDPAFTVPRSTSDVGPLGLWMVMDPQYVLEHGEPLLDDPSVRSAWLVDMLIFAAGYAGDETRLRSFLERHPEMPDSDPKELAKTKMFWLSVFGHFDEAAKALAAAEPIAEDDGSTWAASDSQGVPAKLRILRATGRTAEADALAEKTLATYRAQRARNPEGRLYDYLVRDAALAANEGHKEEAVKLLQELMRWQDVPFGFAPGLPWFKSLEGYAPYDKLIAERAQRVQKARTGMLALDATLTKGETSGR